MTSWEGDEVEMTALNPRRGMPGGIRRRKLWGAAGVAAVAAGLALNWGLTVVGAAPIMLAVLPCAAMCALGLRMGQRRHGASSVGSRGDGAVRPYRNAAS